MVSALFAISSKIGQIDSVSEATKTTGPSEVIVDAASGCASIQDLSEGMKSAMFVRDVKAQKRETGKICDHSARTRLDSHLPSPRLA